MPSNRELPWMSSQPTKVDPARLQKKDAGQAPRTPHATNDKISSEKAQNPWAKTPPSAPNLTPQKHQTDDLVPLLYFESADLSQRRSQKGTPNETPSDVGKRMVKTQDEQLTRPPQGKTSESHQSHPVKMPPSEYHGKSPGHQPEHPATLLDSVHAGRQTGRTQNDAVTMPAVHEIAETQRRHLVKMPPGKLYHELQKHRAEDRAPL